MRKIQFRKLYFRVTERDYGSYIPAIIVFEKYAFMHETKRLSVEDAFLKGCDIEVIVTRYKNRLHIDLWICIISFFWESKK